MLQLTSPSKINVFLEVLGKRADGFHELETVMLRTDLCDTLTFEPSSSGQVQLRLDPATPENLRTEFPLDSSNLILRAATALRQAGGCTQGAIITVTKRIPAAAGLAGGSGNAATTLRGLNELWNLNLSTEDLHAIGMTLGSDINFFIADCRAAVCTGRGEIVSPIRLQADVHVVAARPQTGNSTSQVFASVGNFADRRGCEAIVAALESGQGRLDPLAFNRLTPSARRLNNEMSILMDKMAMIAGRTVLMSGSGSTCFAFADSEHHATELTQAFKADLQSDAGFIRQLKI